MKLHYIGPERNPQTAIPLPSGWPAKDHEDTDRERVKAKLESGMYEKVETRSRKADDSSASSDGDKAGKEAS